MVASSVCSVVVIVGAGSGRFVFVFSVSGSGTDCCLDDDATKSSSSFAILPETRKKYTY